LLIAGCTVNIDAMGCQTDIVELIRKRKPDYLIASKGNQPTLLEGVRRSFDLLKPEMYSEQVACGHGQVETRRCEMIADLKWIESKGDWKDLGALARVTSTRHLKFQGKTSEETRYHITNRTDSGQAINEAVRMHWGIEKNLHWVLDVAFSEDQARNRMGNSDHNLSIVRRMAINILKTDNTRKGSFKIKRQTAAIRDDFREILLKV
jgi:predicted transposase YbfD/YdcC